MRKQFDWRKRGDWLLILALVAAVLLNGLPTVGQSQTAPQTVKEKRYKPELVVQTGHASFVESVIFSPDGQTIASGGDDNTIKLWNFETGQELKTLGHGSGVQSVAFSPDGKTLASAGYETIKLWNVESGQQLRTFAGHANLVHSVVFSPDGRMLVSGGQDKTIKLWNIEKGQELKTLTGHAGRVESIAFSPDGKTLASGSEDKTVKLWNIETGQQLKSLESHISSGNSVAFSPDGKILASANRKTVKLWNIETGQEFKTLTGHTDSVYSVTFSPDGRTLASGSLDGTAKLWNIELGQESKTLIGHTGSVQSVVYSTDGKTIASGSYDHTVKLWNVESGQELKTLTGHNNLVTSVAFSPDSRTLASASYKTINLWNVETGKWLRTLNGHINWINAVVFSPDGKTLASLGNWDKTVKLWDVESGQELRTLIVGYNKLAPSVSSIESVAFSPDGRTLATGSFNGTVNLLKVETGQVIKTLIGHTESVQTVVFSTDGKTLASGSYDKTVKLWSIESGQELKTLRGHTSSVDLVAFSPDGMTLASVGFVTKFWNIESGQELKSLAEPDFLFYSVEFSPDGKIIVFGDEDHTIRIWSVETGKQLSSLKGHTNLVGSVVFSPNGKILVSGSQDGTVKLWGIQSGVNLVTLTPLGKDDWVVTDSEGRFDTNKDLNKIEGLIWVLPDQPLTPRPLEIFMRQYYEPGFLQRILKCNEEIEDDGTDTCDKEFKPLPSIAEINHVQPKIEIKEIKPKAKDSDTVDVVVEVENIKEEITRNNKKENLSSGVFDLRLFRDGQMIGNSTPQEKLEKFYQAAPDLIEQNKKYFAETKRLTNTPEDEAWRTANNLAEVKDVKFDGKSKYTYTFKNIKLPRDGRKEVEFTAYAFNADRVKSDNVVKTFPIPATLLNNPQPKRAFVVAFGVNKYQSSSWDLQFAANDARAMRGILADKLRKTGDFAEVVEIPLISDDETVKEQTIQKRDATKQNVRTVLELLAGKTLDEKRLKTLTHVLGAETVGKIKPTNPEDAVFISFSSHGYADRNGIFYILPTDIGANMPRTVTPELLRNSISSDELSLWLRDVDAGEMVMIVDACNAEAAVKNSEFKPAPMGSRGLGQLAYDKGMKILTATQAANVAIETGAIGHGLLTYALVGEGLGKENKADFRAADKTINLKEWLEYGEFRVPGLYDDLLNKRLKIIGKGTDVIDLSGDNSKQNSSSQTPVLFDFTKRRQELTLVRLP